MTAILEMILQEGTVEEFEDFLLLNTTAIDLNEALKLAKIHHRRDIAQILLANGASLAETDSEEALDVPVGSEEITKAMEKEEQVTFSPKEKIEHRKQEEVTNSLEDFVQMLFTSENRDINQLLIEMAKHGQFDRVQFLLVNGALTKSVDELGNTALMYAAEQGHEDIAKILLSYQANVNAENKEKKTPLMLAIENRHIPLFHRLLDHKATLAENITSTETLLQYARRKGGKNVVSALLLRYVTTGSIILFEYIKKFAPSLEEQKQYSEEIQQTGKLPRSLWEKHIRKAYSLCIETAYRPFIELGMLKEQEIQAMFAKLEEEIFSSRFDVSKPIPLCIAINRLNETININEGEMILEPFSQQELLRSQHMATQIVSAIERSKMTGEKDLSGLDLTSLASPPSILRQAPFSRHQASSSSSSHAASSSSEQPERMRTLHEIYGRVRELNPEIGPKKAMEEATLQYEKQEDVNSDENSEENEVKKNNTRRYQ